MWGYDKGYEADDEKEALASLLKALAKEEDCEEEEACPPLIIVKKKPLSDSEEVEEEMMDGQGITEDAEDSLEEDEEDLGEDDEEETMSLKEKVKSFMMGPEDPFAKKQGIGMGMAKMEVLEKPLMKMVKKRRKRNAR